MIFLPRSGLPVRHTRILAVLKRAQVLYGIANIFRWLA